MSAMPTVPEPDRQAGQGYWEHHVCASCDHFAEVGGQLVPLFREPVIEDYCQCGGLVICCPDCQRSLLAQP